MSLRYILFGGKLGGCPMMECAVCLVNSGSLWPGPEGKEMIEMQKCKFAGGRDGYGNT
jgi:hypothetical protein